MTTDPDPTDNTETSAQHLRKRSVVIAGHATSISLEDIFWQLLKELAQTRGQSLASLITDIDSRRQVNLSSALRVFVLKSVLDRQNDDSADEI